jgi:hypothetical protein
MQRFRQTGNATDRPRAGRPCKTTPREDRLISRRAQQRPFSTAGGLRGNLALGGHISTRIVIKRLIRECERDDPLNVHSWHYVIAMLDLTGHMIIWGELLAHGDGSTDGRARVLRQRNTSFQDNHILGKTAFGGGGVTVFSLTISWTCTFLMVI